MTSFITLFILFVVFLNNNLQLKKGKVEVCLI